MLRSRSKPTSPRSSNLAIELLVPPEHAHKDFLTGCVHDTLARLMLPSLEREARRELTEKAETHAVEVFARNLRNLLLQPPLHRQARAGDRSRLQERLQARGARRVRLAAGSRRDPRRRQRRAESGRPREAGRADHRHTTST